MLSRINTSIRNYRNIKNFWYEIAFKFLVYLRRTHVIFYPWMELEIKRIQRTHEIFLRKASAILLKTCYIGPFIETIRDTKQFQIPKYLKRVKKMNEKYCYVLFMMGEYDAFHTVLVPSGNSFKNKNQYEHYNRIWPVCWYPHEELPIDQNYVSHFIQHFKNISYQSIMSNQSIMSHQGCSNECFVIDPIRFQLLVGIFELNSHILHPIIDCITAVSKHTAKHHTNYICTGLDMFLTHEPCESCAMALIHGRVKRVFYLISGSDTFEKKFFHENKSFNHRFLVYKIFIDTKKHMR